MPEIQPPLHPLPLEELPALPDLRLAVIGHVEVVEFLQVPQLPTAGAIVRARSSRLEPAGGGAVVAVQLARLLGQPVPFFTALGRDRAGEEAAAALEALGLEVHVAWRQTPTRRAITYVDDPGERTITVIGERLAATAADPLPWPLLTGCDGVFVTACDAAALQQARQARVLAVTPRLGLPVLQTAGVTVDLLVGSALDPSEQVPAGALQHPVGLRIATRGAEGGELEPGGRFLAPQRHRPVVDTYGAGDSFAAGVTAGLAAGWSLHQALSLGCHCGASCLNGAGPYSGQLRRGSGAWLQP